LTVRVDRNLDSGELVPFTHEPLLYPNFQIFNNAQSDAQSAPLPADATTDNSSSTNGVLSPPASHDQFNTSSAPLSSTMSSEASIFNQGNNPDIMGFSQQAAIPPPPMSVPIEAINGVNGATAPSPSTPGVTFCQLKGLTRFLLDCGIHPCEMSTDNLISLINTTLKVPLMYSLVVRYCGRNAISTHPAYMSSEQQQKFIGFMNSKIPRTAEGVGSAAYTVEEALEKVFDFLETSASEEWRTQFDSDALDTLTGSMDKEEHVVIINALIREDCSNQTVSNIVRQMLEDLRSPGIA
jgi:hypothetical protein